MTNTTREQAGHVRPSLAGTNNTPRTTSHDRTMPLFSFTTAHSKHWKERTAGHDKGEDGYQLMKILLVRDSRQREERLAGGGQEMKIPYLSSVGERYLPDHSLSIETKGKASGMKVSGVGDRGQRTGSISRSYGFGFASYGTLNFAGPGERWHCRDLGITDLQGNMTSGFSTALKGRRCRGGTCLGKGKTR